MKFIIASILIIIFVANSHGEDAPTFCQSVPPGMYCNSDVSGFYWCLPQTSQSVIQQCPLGTNCQCFQGPVCTSVPTVGNGSPCGFPTATFSYASSFTATQTIISYEIDPVCHVNTTSQTTVYLNGNSERVDSTSITENSCTPGNTLQHTQDFYFLNSNGSVTHYAYNVDANSCAGSITSGPLPNSGIPNGYEYFGSSTYRGQSVNIYYFMNGLTFPEELYGYTDYIYVSTSNLPVYEARINYSFRVNDGIDTTWNSFTAGAPPSSTFDLPAACTA